MPDYAIDAAPGLIKRERAQAAVTATGYVGVPWDQGAPVATDFICVINLENPKVSGANETYDFVLVGYNTANRSDATILARTNLSAATSALETVAPAAGDRLVLKARTEKRGIPYRYVDLHMTPGGTSPSVTFNAYLTVEH